MTVTVLQQLDPVAIGLVAKEAEQRAQLAKKDEEIALLRQQKQAAVQALDHAVEALKRLQELFQMNRLKPSMFDDAIKLVCRDRVRVELTT